MLIITGSKLSDHNMVDTSKLKCLAVEHSSIIAAATKTTNPSLNECTCSGKVEYLISLKPAEDMVMPVTLCSVHFNAIKLSLFEEDGNTIAIDMDLFK